MESSAKGEKARRPQADFASLSIDAGMLERH
jgi:hypothetical protein